MNPYLSIFQEPDLLSAYSTAARTVKGTINQKLLTVCYRTSSPQTRLRQAHLALCNHLANLYPMQ